MLKYFCDKCGKEITGGPSHGIRFNPQLDDDKNVVPDTDFRIQFEVTKREGEQVASLCWEPCLRDMIRSVLE